MKRICVFCGSSPGSRPEYVRAARHLGTVLANNGIGLVYGGAKVGMMGYLASAVLESGGEVTGVIPKGLVDKEVAFFGLNDLRIVETMHERKALMSELSDGFIALPGGLGTIEEFFEIVTWAQLGFHKKPCGLLNINNYYDNIINFLEHSVSQQFIDPDHRSMIMVDETPEGLLAKFDRYRPSTADKAKIVLKMMDSMTKV
ncbi:TIGR00730 family Rossman fold protein [Methanocella sp. CWC-04]|uniref:TIGR00730 family Rossman fold protein n=1 Tax=Methanooceanicella nereidis TaxID=2052831 RepID=A0AAP2REH5_9EURY|nr:TIGR00730 family Rossman fold protein [Methanocella sp. CWC-04]MCD1295878.1 TIGR00730 family Rossman fold protein [Methanocella sp. CWC-04]